MTGSPSELKRAYLGHQTLGFTTVGALTTAMVGVTETSLAISDTTEMTPEIGTLSPASFVTQTEQHGEGSVEGVLSYEQAFIFPLSMIFGRVTLTSTSTSATYWDYKAPSTGGATLHTQAFYTLHHLVTGGALDVNAKIIGAFPQGFNISAEAGGLWTYRLDLLGKRITSTPLTTGFPGLTTLNAVRFADTSFYVDTWTGSVGGTAFAGKLISFELDGNTNYHLKQYSGSLYPDSVGRARWEGTLTTIVEFEATARTLVYGLTVGTGKVQRQFRISATKAGATEVRLDFAGTLADGAELWSDRDGNVTMELVWAGTYNITMGGWLQARSVNSSATM